MHYDPFACAKSRNNPVITYPGTNDPVKLTKTSTFSDLDIAQINKMYPCDANPVTTTQKPTTKPTPKPTTTAATTTTAEPQRHAPPQPSSLQLPRAPPRRHAPPQPSRKSSLQLPHA